MNVIAEELHKPARRKFLRRKVDIRDLNETFEGDLIDMSSYAKENKGFKFLLTVIDTFSKFAYAIPLKSKNATDVTSAFEKILKKGRIPKHLHVDRGKEFYNNLFKSLMKKYNINLFSTYSNIKASIVERFNRTLKEKMWKKFTSQGNYKWVEILPSLVKSYNDSFHRTIGMKPNEVNHQNSERLRKLYANSQISHRKKYKFKVGDKVRISKYKHVFEKGYTPNWSTEIFTISRVKNTFPETYELEDYQKNPIEGGFYKEELQKSKNPDVYLIEKVLKRRGNKIFVKWIGFDNTHNSWVHKDTQK